jgi:recombination protein RecA
MAKKKAIAAKVENKIEKLKIKINKDFGFNALRYASELEESAYRISWGSVSLDIASGGGIPIGRCITVAGGESAAKSAVCYHAIREFQKCFKRKILWERYSTKDKPVYRWEICKKTDEGAEPLVCALIQSESHSFTKKWAKKIGIDLDRLLIQYPVSMEEALNIGEELHASGLVDLIVYDSYTAMSPESEMEADMGKNTQMGRKQYLFGKYNGKVNGLNNKADREGRLPTTIMAIAQLREKIGMMHGNPEYVAGGRSNKHQNGIELRLRKSDMINRGTKDEPDIVGQTIKFKFEKNKTSRPYQTGEFDFYMEDDIVAAGQIDNAKELIIEAISYGVIEQRGAWFYYKGKQVSQGQDKAIEFFRDKKNAKMFDEVKNATLEVASTGEVIKADVYGDDIYEDEIEEIAPAKPAKKVTIIKKGNKKK